MEFEKVDPLAFLICPAFSELRDTPYCGIQFIYTTLDELEKNKDYDQNEVKKLKEMNLITDKTTGSVNSTSNDKSIRDIRIQYAGLQDINQAGIDTVELNE
ncbi:MAG: hypothetical protein ORN26_02065 [Candidatus Pacebacteria bacterium]|nr:hypothetical protein [Candidatus Paceibacterota bacterium]